MLSFTTITTELQASVMQYLDIPALKALRLTCRTISAIAVVQLFHTVVLRFTDNSAARLEQVLASDRLRPLVRRIILDGRRDTEEDDREWLEDQKREELPWSIAISKIARLPSLKEVELQFDDEQYSDWHRWLDDFDMRSKYREDYMKQTFAALQNTTLVGSLTIFHLLDANCTCPGPQFRDSDDKVTKPDINAYGCGKCWCVDTHFVALRSQLKRLALMIAVTWDDAAPEMNIEEGAVHECFNLGLANLWLKPTRLQLTHLTLYADVYWGIYPFSDLRGLCFLNLKSLALGKFSIAHDWQIDWITSHGETLEELILDDCPIAYALRLGDYDARDNDWEEDSIKLVAMRWSNVFPSFQQRLQNLRHFGVGHGQWSNDKMFECRYDMPARIEPSRYVSYQNGQGPTPWSENDVGSKHIKWDSETDGEILIEVPDCKVEDQASLGVLLQAIRYRKAERSEPR